MADALDLPEPDKLEAAPHPREAARVHGHEAAETEFLEAFNADRLHHAWLISGPMGIGKATLAWRLARFVLTAPPRGAGLLGEPEPLRSLDAPADHPAVPRINALAHPDLFLLRRGPNDKGDRLETQITARPTRKLSDFLSLTSETGRRVVIVDAADEMNSTAANALRTNLEEPPKGTVFLLVSHQPSRLLPTIRSRCRMLRLSPLPPAELARAVEGAGLRLEADADALAELAAGSVGGAIRLVSGSGVERYQRLLKLFSDRLDRAGAIAFAEETAGRGAEEVRSITVDLSMLFLSRLARAGSFGKPPPEAVPGDAGLLSRLSPHAAAGRGWAALAQELSDRVQYGLEVNLDPAALILDMLVKIEAHAAHPARVPR